MNTDRKPRKWRKVVLVTVVIGFVCLLAAHVGISLWIGADVRAMAAQAMQQYDGERVEALMQYVDDPSHSYRDRNRAVWALGQLGDARALPTAKKYYTGDPCDHDAALCQRELSKAIVLLEGGFNATAVVWRRSSD